MAEESSFLASIAANPEDDTVREVYCDWLQEQPPVDTEGRSTGYHERAEFIQSQIHRTRTYCNFCENTGFVMGCAGDRSNPPCSECGPIMVKELSLLSDWAEKWFPGPHGTKLTTEFTTGFGWSVSMLVTTTSTFDRVAASTFNARFGLHFWRGFPHTIQCRTLNEFDGFRCWPCDETGYVAQQHYDPASDTMKNSGSRFCEPCEGTGRIVRLGEEITKQYPIGLVKIDDFRPRHWPVENIWMWERLMNDYPEILENNVQADARHFNLTRETPYTADRLPPKIFDALTGGETGGYYLMINKFMDRRYKSLKDAEKALSDVLLERARQPRD